MKYLLSLFLLAVSCMGYSQTLKPEQAKDSIGKIETVCGAVTGTHTVEASGVTFLNMGSKYPNNAFTVVIFKDDAAKFPYQFYTLEGKTICVTGMIKDYKGKAEIVVSEADKLKITDATTTLTPRE